MPRPIVANMRPAIAASAAARHERMLQRLATGRKWCPRCRRWLSLDDFYAPPSKAGISDGRSAYCRQCEIAAVLARRGAPRQHELAAASDALAVRKKRTPLPDHRLREPPIPDLPRKPDFSRGLCTTSPQHHFWSSDLPAERRLAAEACQYCPVQPECLQWALSVSETYTSGAIWAGLSEAERKIRAAGRVPVPREYIMSALAPHARLVTRAARSAGKARRQAEHAQALARECAAAALAMADAVAEAVIESTPAVTEQAPFAPRKTAKFDPAHHVVTLANAPGVSMAPLTAAELS
jgi:hypothetical protein